MSLNMLVFWIIPLLSAVFLKTEGCGDNSEVIDLKCWSCSNATSWKDCNEQSTVENCTLSKPFCVTTFGPGGENSSLSRECATTDVCTYNTPEDMAYVCTSASKEVINIRYSIENALSAANQFSFSLQMVVEKQDMYQIMLLAEKINSNFKFTATEFPPYGMFISSINGLSGIDPNYWRISKRYDGRDDEPLNVGVSTHVPCDGEHIVWAYTEYIAPEPAPTTMQYNFTTARNTAAEQSTTMKLDSKGCDDNNGAIDLKCWSCSNATSWKDCNEKSTVENCTVSRPFCMTTLASSEETSMLSRGCASTDVCTYKTQPDIKHVCTPAAKEVINLKYSIENSLPAASRFSFTLEMVVEKQTLYNAMLLAQEMDSNFKFTGSEFPPYGMFISSINGLSGSGSNYWSVSKRYQGRDDEPLSVGVSAYVPCDGEHIVWAYINDKHPTASGAGESAVNSRVILFGLLLMVMV